MKSLLVLISLLSAPVSFAANAVPDFTVQIGQIGQPQHANVKEWLLNLLPPAGFHINTEAPMEVSALHGQINFTKVGAVLTHAGFRGVDSKLVEGTSTHADLYLCDDQKTVCVKKSLEFALATNSDLKHLNFKKPPSGSSHSEKNPKNKKDEHGFWDNDAASAIAEAMRTQKPLLIDFYGIWCPPCNLYDETVFPKKAFKTAAQQWVLLKMDADKAPSFELKSHFKVGGYPSLVLVKVPKSNEVAALSEMDRIVGYYPLPEFLHLLSKAYANRDLSLDEKLAMQKSDYLKTLKDAIAIKIEQQAWSEALALAETGQKLAAEAKGSNEEHFFAMTTLSIHAKEKPEVLKEKSASELMKAVFLNREHETTETLLALGDLIRAQSEQLSKETVLSVFDIMDTIATRVVPDTLTVPGVELSIADIDFLRLDTAEILKDQALINAATAREAASYQKMIEQFHLEDSRGMNLEYAYYLFKSGAIDQAKAIYAKFIQKYPKEFTFYYAAAKMDLELKDLKSAREHAEKAVQYAYGDNKLRAAERLVRVLSAQGETAAAVKVGNEVLGKTPIVSEDLAVRTNRYINALKKAVADAQKGTS